MATISDAQTFSSQQTFSIAPIFSSLNGVVVANGSTSLSSFVFGANVQTALTAALNGTGAISATTSPAFLGTPTAPTQATGDVSTALATDAFAATAFMGRNRLINGDMSVDQANAGASNTTGNAYGPDQWKSESSAASKGTWGQNLNAVTWASSASYYYGFQSSSAYSVAASDYFDMKQAIEGTNMQDFMFGTVLAQPITLSFHVYSSLTGTFGGAIRNGATTRSYPFTYTIPVANTETVIKITIPGDTGGSWPLGTGAGLTVDLSLGAGAAFSGPAGSWSNNNYVTATGAVSVVGTNAATFYVTEVQLEVGSVATPFERQTASKTLLDCERYFQSLQYVLNGYVGATGITVGGSMLFQVPMRAIPTLIAGATANSGPIPGSNTLGGNIKLATVTAVSSGSGGFSINQVFTADARI
jgi:hypothetical protein